ncbi:M20 family metallopeptidase [Paenibacillus nasutitermitis]|uniref:Amidohydrolase YhaA n=1 Tax=Paenibacillus nasutitermitis TaxID=1652958 RepID=A0A917DS85_9BACL|nr:M20 family metallopeptidase [Paenibacillus nasutitermitis]GGD65178.1 putative amidohydrolase YhaA [Paenibacillus nasutitermitis]
MGNRGEIDAMLQTGYPDMVKWRRYLHQHPELSFQEKETSRWIAGQLAGLGCEVKETEGGYGLAVSIKGELPGPVIALRADMDALPIQDEKTCDYASTVPGVMHACGHDAHTATLLGIARYYSTRRERLHGERRLLFQPAEELTPGGALGMIGSGVLTGVDVIYGVHLWTPLPYGVAATRSGPIMASPDEIFIDIKGRGGHGGMPHETVDAVLVGSAIVQALQTIVSRNIDPLEPAVVSIGSFHAGTTGNVIAEHCRLTGTVRTFNQETREHIKERMEQIVKQTAELHGAEAVLEYRHGYPPVVNDEAEAQRFFNVTRRHLGEDSVRESSLIMAGEDFSYYLKEIPGCFLFVGAGNKELGAVYPHHHPKFDLDERSMLVSAKLMIAMAENYASGE